MTISEMTLRIQRGPRASLVMSIVNRLASATTWAAALFLALMIGSVQSAEPPTTKYKYDTLIQQGKSQLDGSAEQAAAAGKAAIKMSPERWEGYALVGGALMNLKRYEEAADTLSKAIERAPQSKQPTLRDLRRQCLLAESGSPAVANTPAPATTTSQAEIVLWKSIESSTNLADFESYLAQYPNGAFAVLARRHLMEAKTKIENDAWDQMRGSGNLADLQSFIDQFPHGEHAESARSQMAATKQATLSRELSMKDEIARVMNDAERSLVSIPTGTFNMGSPRNETGRDPNEGTQREVSVTSFMLSKYLVTRADFSTFVRATDFQINSGCDAMKDSIFWGSYVELNWENPGFNQTSSEPLVCVTIEAAQAYADWLNTKSARHFRLPTEAEYEYAARAGSTSIYYWGVDASLLCTYENVADRSFSAVHQIPGLFPCDDHAVYTAPVGSYKANAFGLYDILGNVREWTSDCFGSAVGPSRKCIRNVVRGASWQSPISETRLAVRTGLADRARNDVGFRLAAD
jgi:formylglycine-generating enzyme